MVMAEKLGNEVQAWGILAIIIVLVSIILLKFKDVTGVTAALNTTIDTFVTALSEPKNWVVIAIIALIGFSILKYFKGKK